MKLLLLGHVLISPKDYQIRNGKICSVCDDCDFWEEDVYTIIDTREKTYIKFKVEKETQKYKPYWCDKTETLTLIHKIKNFFTNTIYMDANRWKVLTIPTNVQKGNLDDLNTGYDNDQTYESDKYLLSCKIIGE